MKLPMISRTRLMHHSWLISGLLVLLLLPLGCNVVETTTDHKINIRVSPDLSIDSGKYDKIRVNILDTNKTILYDGAYNGAWKDSGSGQINGIDLGTNPPSLYLIEVIAYKGGVKKLEYLIKVNQGKASEKILVFLDTTKATEPTTPETPIDSSLPPVEKSPIGVFIFEGELVTLVEKSAVTLSVQVNPPEAKQAVIWTSSNTLAVEVDSLGGLKSHSAGMAVVKVTCKANPLLFDTIQVNVVKVSQVEGIRLSVPSVLVYVGGETKSISASFLPNGINGVVEYQSLDTGIATINSFGVITGKKAGSTTVVGNPFGYPKITDSLQVVVVKDVPVIDAGSDRNIKVGDEVTFSVKVTQQYGKVAILKWDLDGDKIPDDSVSAEMAEVKHVYTVAGIIEVTFYARDSEGNTTTLVRRVVVGSLAPFVEITKPSKDTSITTAKFTVEYSVDKVKKTQNFILVEGYNPIVIKDTGVGGIGKDSLSIFVDSKAPIVRIISPSDSFQTNKSSISIKWSIDGIDQSINTTAPLSLEGPIEIQRESVDSLGNKGTAKITVIRDITPPDVKITSPVENALVTSTSVMVAWTVDSKPRSDSTTEILKAVDGPQTITRTVTDLAGNTATATRNVILDRKGYKVLITSPAEGFLTNLASVPVIWSIDNVNQTTLTTESFSVGDGPKTITRSTTDAAGKTVSYSVAGTVDRTSPNAPSVGAILTPTQSATPIFRWVAEGGGNGTFQFKINDTNFATGATTTTSLSHTPSALTTDGKRTLYVRERDAAGNWSGATPIAIMVDLNSPVVTISGGNRSISTTTTTVTFTATDGTGTGIQSAVCSWGTSGTSTATLSGSNWSCPVSGLVANANSVRAQATDISGRVGFSTVTITVNVPISKVIIAPRYKRFATSENKPTITYTIDGVSGSNTPTLITEGDNQVIITSNPNSVGQSGADTAHIFFRPNVLFVRESGTGDGKGTSWENAVGGVATALDMPKGQAANTEIWVMQGAYSTPPPQTLTRDNFYIAPKVSMYGAFNGNGSAVSLSDRNTTYATTLAMHPENRQSSPSIVNLQGVIDGFSLLGRAYVQGISAWGSDFEIRNIKITDWLYLQSDNSYAGTYPFSIQGNGLLDGVEVSGCFADFTGMQIGGMSSTIRVNNTRIIDNRTNTFDGPGMIVGSNAKVTISGKSVISGNYRINSGPQYYQIYTDDGAQVNISADSQIGGGVNAWGGTGNVCFESASKTCP